MRENLTQLDHASLRNLLPLSRTTRNKNKKFARAHAQWRRSNHARALDVLNQRNPVEQQLVLC